MKSPLYDIIIYEGQRDLYGLFLFEAYKLHTEGHIMNNEVKGNGVNFLLLLLNIFIFVTRVMDYYDALNQFSEGSISRVKVYEEMLMVIIWWTLVMLGISFLIESRYAKHKSSTTSRKITILGIFSAICLLPPVFYIMYVNYGLNKPLSIDD